MSRVLPLDRDLQSPHLTVQSVVATGGVYKGQGRIRRKLVTFDYKGFLVQAPQLQGTIPGTSLFQRFPTFFQEGLVTKPKFRTVLTRYHTHCRARAA